MCVGVYPGSKEDGFRVFIVNELSVFYTIEACQDM